MSSLSGLDEAVHPSPPARAACDQAVARLGRVSSLTTRALNRALLARQLLLGRSEMPVPDALEHLVGLQAQNPRDPYLGLWSRLRAFDPAQLSDLLARRRAVRISLMRSTIHLVTAGDALAIRPVLQSWLERNLSTATPFGRQIDGIDVRALAAAGHELLVAEPMTFAELGRRLSERFPGYDPTALGYAVREYVPLVQVPPRGLWGESGRALHTPAEHWLEQPFGPAPEIQPLLDRYLRAFGPATMADFAAWSGLPVGPLSKRFGREPLDIDGAPLPDGDTPAPVRFLPDYDNVLLAHADRTRILPEGARGRDVIGRPTVLVDGFVAAFWKLERRTGAITVSPLRTLTAAERRDVLAEAELLLGQLLAPGGPAKPVHLE
jgi:hypothetical protein